MVTNAYRILPVAAMLTILIVGFQNCGQTRFTDDPGSASLRSLNGVSPTDPSLTSATDPSQDGVVDPTVTTAIVPEDDHIAMSGACEVFSTSPMPTIAADAQDIAVDGGSSNLEIPMAKTLTINNHSADALVWAAASASLDHMSGHLIQVRALEVPLIDHISSSLLCIQTGHLGRVVNISGKSKIIAQQIDEIYNSSATMHIYGALVKSVTNSSGRICLHDGATVLNRSNNSGGIFIGECE